MKRQFLHYNPKLKQRARELHNNSTLSEVLLWKELKGKQMMGYDFHRQKPIDNFIVDFFCSKLCLVIEIDGDSHSLREKEDADRQRRLENLGLCFLRFDDLDVKFQMEKVLTTLREWIKKHEHTNNP